MLVTIDNYYNVDFYNQCLTALKNNGVQFTEHLSITGAYNWYIDVPRLPIMLNYETCSKGEERYVISKVIALTSDSQYRYYRRLDSLHRFDTKYILNDVLADIKDKEAWVIKVSSREHLLALSRLDVNSKIWYLGRYLDGRIKLAVITSSVLRMMCPRELILMEKKATDKIERFESELNYRVLMGKERLVKYDTTPYFISSKFVVPPYYPENVKTRFMVF